MGEVIPFPGSNTNFAGKSIGENGELDTHFESQIEAQEQQDLESSDEPHYNWLVRKWPQYFLTPSQIVELIEHQRSDSVGNDELQLTQTA